jgi:hypothetical protein
VALISITTIYAGANCVSNMVAATSTLGFESINVENCDNEPICQISCSQDYKDDFVCQGTDPTPKDVLNSPWAVQVLIPPKFGVSAQYKATCGPHSDPSGRIDRGMKWIVDVVGPDVKNKVSMFPINFLLGKSKVTTAKNQIAAGTALCLNAEFQQFWKGLGRKCAREAHGKIPQAKIMAEFRAYPWKDKTILANIAIVDTVDKWNTDLIRMMFEKKLQEQNQDVASQWKWVPSEIPNIFWHYTAYLANLRASCKCWHVAQTLEKNLLPDGTKGEPNFINLPVLKELRDMGRQVCASKFPQCKPKAGGSKKVLEFDSESNTEDISNAM